MNRRGTATTARRRAAVLLAALLGVLSLATLLAAVPMAQPVAAASASPAAPPPPPVTGTVLDLALLDLRAQSWKPAPRLAPDHRGMQVVGLDTWLAIDPAAWQTLSTFQSDGAIAVAATATPVRTVWVFSDEVVRCDGPGVQYTPGAPGPPPCGREWEHTTAVAPMAMEVYIEYRVEWESSTGETGTIDPLAGDSLGQFDLTVGEIQSVGTLGDDPHPDDPGITEADLGSRAACTLVMLSAGQCSDPQDPPVPSQPGTGGEKGHDCGFGTYVSFWKWGSGDAFECAKEDAGDVIDYVKEKATELYALLPGPLQAVVDALAGCAEFGIDAVKNLWSSVETIGRAIADPQGFVTEQLELLKSLKQALETDPEGFIKEFLGEQVDLQLLQENKAKWIGKMGCEVAVALFSAGAGSSTRIGKIFSRIDDIKAWVNGKLHLPGGKDHIPGEGDPIPGDHIPGDGDPIPGDGTPGPGDKPPDGDGPTCSLGGSCGCNSFPAGTLVALADGTPVPIELIGPGDRVLTYDTVSAAWRSQPVLSQWSAVDHGSMATVAMAGGAITATDHHRFWVDSRGAWVDLVDVQPGDLLLTPDGVTPVDAVGVGPVTATVVWELDVAFDDDFVVTQGDVTALVHNADCTKPTKPANPSAKPSGQPEEIPPKSDPETRRSLERQNQTANDLAKLGYDVEQQPRLTAQELIDAGLNPNKNPDYLIDGKIFDAYSPSGNRPRNIWENIRAEKLETGQTRRIVLNLDDSDVDLAALRQQFQDYPMTAVYNGQTVQLEEVIFVTKGQVVGGWTP